MKRSDIAMIILIATISVGVAYGSVSSIPALKAPNKATKVDSIERYSSSIEEPDPEVFNSQAINPTVDITIGGVSDSSDTTTDSGDSDAATSDDEEPTSQSTNDEEQ